MELLDWTSILIILSSSITAYWKFKTVTKSKSVTDGILFISLILLIVYNTVYLFDHTVIGYDPFIWIQLLILLTLSSGLFSLIRDLKPKFSQFPLILVFIPFITILFFPLVSDTQVIINLVFASYQGGCLAVALLLLSIKQSKTHDQAYQIVGCSILGISFFIYWFIKSDSFETIPLTEILLSIGVILYGVGINKKNTDVTTD